MRQRSTVEVFEDHLALAQEGELEADLIRNVATDIVLLTTYGVFRGYDWVRQAAALLERQIGRTTYTYRNRQCHGNHAFLEWSAETELGTIDDGADSYLIRDGRIQSMTIHYTVRARPRRRRPVSAPLIQARYLSASGPKWSRG
ncbi:MAG: nuclear transport factor 2 family protein [Gemmatimonadales bacterium]